VILGVWAALRYRGWKNWVVTLIGVWMIIAGFWFPSSYAATVGNDIVAGAGNHYPEPLGLGGASKVFTG
jgi:hypothetical protein